MTRAVYLLTYLDNQTGGMERQALQLARRLRAKGRDIFFITCAHWKTIRKEHLPLYGEMFGFRVYRIPLLNGWPTLNAILYAMGGIMLLFLTQRKYQIIHAHQLHTSGMVAAVAKWFMPRKKLIVKNCCGGEFGDVQFLTRFPFGAEMLRRAGNAFIAISEETAREMEEINLVPIIRIPNGVDVNYFRPPREEEKFDARETLRVAQSEKVVLFVGKLDPQKNIPVLIEAMNKIESRLICLIVGEGSLKAELEKKIVELGLADRIRLCGVTGDARVFYWGSDILVLPSRAEGISNVLLEAMASGLPVVVSDIEGNRHVVCNAENGYLVPCADVSGLASSIEKLLTNPPRAKQIGALARETIEKRFSIDSVVDAYATLYDTLRKV